MVPSGPPHFDADASEQSGICKYSHDYLLTPEQLNQLANNAKKAPCNWLKNGEWGTRESASGVAFVDMFRRRPMSLWR